MGENNHGFYIKTIAATGDNVRPAILEFEKGFNLISGASDTGKSYVFSCLEFMVGRSESPKDIPESKGYSGIYLEIRTFDETPYTIFRKFGDQKCFVRSCKYPDFKESKEQLAPLNITHSATSSDNISTFLLNLCGIGRQKLKRNQDNKKGSLTFTDIRKLTFIHEERIITESSPFYYSQSYTDQTKNQSFLNYLLTGEDASDLKERESKEITKAKLLSKLELLNDQLENKMERYRDIAEVWESKGYSEDSESFESLNMELVSTNKEVESLVELRTDFFRKIQKLNRDIKLNDELKSKFSLLQEHYKSDLKRLGFVIEGENLLAQLNDQTCPVCFQEMEEDHIHAIQENTGLFNSIVAEHQKIVLKSKDLDDAIVNVRSKNRLLKEELLLANEKYDAVNAEINDELTPKMNYIESRLQAIVDEEAIKLKMKILDNEITEIVERKSELENDLENIKVITKASIVDPKKLTELTKFISKRLSSWNYLDKEVITFDSSYSGFDILIGTKLRKSYGKGKRGVSYAACVLGIMDYCQANQRPFSNLVVLDSPLTAYESNKAQKGKSKIASDIVDSFFENLSKLDGNKQVIMFDNKIPEPSIRRRINFIEFSGDEESDNYGFFPMIHSKSPVLIELDPA